MYSPWAQSTVNHFPLNAERAALGIVWYDTCKTVQAGLTNTKSERDESAYEEWVNDKRGGGDE